MVTKNKKLARKQAKKFGVVVSTFNEPITLRLLNGCLNEFAKCGIASKNITVVKVPGAFEIPVAALSLARKKEIAAVVCLGAVIRGETLHYELVAEQAAAGIMQVSLMTQKPVIFGVLATDTIQQADKRSQDKGENKGVEAAQVAISMTNILS